MGGVVVLAAAIRAAIKEIADRIDDDHVGRRIEECGPDGIDDAGDPVGIQQQLQFRGGDEGVACGRDHPGRQADLLHPFAQVVILDLRLQIEHAQRPGRCEAEERHACGHVDEPRDQEVALTDLGRAAEHQQPARRQDAGRDDVIGHRAAIIEQRAKAEGRQRAGGGVGAAARMSRRAVALHAGSTAARPRPAADQAAIRGAAWQRCSRRSPPSLRRGQCDRRALGGCNGRWRRSPPETATSHPPRLRGPEWSARHRRPALRWTDCGALVMPTPGSGGMSATLSAKSTRSTSTGLWSRICTSR